MSTLTPTSSVSATSAAPSPLRSPSATQLAPPPYRLTGAAKVPAEVCTNSDTLKSADTKSGRPSPFISAIAAWEAPGEFRDSAGLNVPGLVLLLKNTLSAPSSKLADTTSGNPSPLRSAAARYKGLDPSGVNTGAAKTPAAVDKYALMLEELPDTGGSTRLSAMTSAKPSPLKSALTTPAENSRGAIWPQSKQPRPSSQLARRAHARASGIRSDFR